MGLPVERALSPHFRPRAREITALVLHYSGSMDLGATVAWMQTRDAQYSVHYLVGREGRVVQLVEDDDVAFHAGRSMMYPQKSNEKREPHVDEFSIGIELIGCADSGFTDRQLESTIMLVEVLMHRYRIHPDRVVGHAQIAPGRKLDPDGFTQQFPWRRVREKAESAYNALQARRMS